MKVSELNSVLDWLKKYDFEDMVNNSAPSRTDICRFVAHEQVEVLWDLLIVGKNQADFILDDLNVSERYQVFLDFLGPFGLNSQLFTNLSLMETMKKETMQELVKEYSKTA